MTKQERALLGKLAGEAWERKLRTALETLFEDFGKWQAGALDSLDLSDTSMLISRLA